MLRKFVLFPRIFREYHKFSYSYVQNIYNKIERVFIYQNGSLLNIVQPIVPEISFFKDTLRRFADIIKVRHFLR